MRIKLSDRLWEHKAIAALLVGCWFSLQINYKFIINYEVLPLALLSRGLRKRQILKSSEPISILFLASQSHKRSYLQLGDLLFYIPSMYRLISWCSGLWHLNRKDAYKKQRQSRRDPNTLPGPWQGQSEKGVHRWHPVEGGAKEGWRSGDHQQLLLLSCPKESERSMPVDGRGCGRGLWGEKHLDTRVSCRDGCLWPSPFSQQHPPCNHRVKDSFPPWCESDAGSRTNNGPTATIGQVLTTQPRQHIPSHTSPLAQLERDSGTGSGRVKTREGNGRRHRGHSGEGFRCGHLWCGPAAQVSRWGAEGGLSPASICKAAVLGLAIPARGRDLVGLARVSPQGGKETSTACASVCFSAWFYHPCSKT